MEPWLKYWLEAYPEGSARLIDVEDMLAMINDKVRSGIYGQLMAHMYYCQSYWHVHIMASQWH
eukprot:8085-Karenia_brevis.AAC.1